MNYDLVLSDFDGTLLSRGDIITPATVKAIREFTARGGIFGVSSGRSVKSLRKRLGELGLDGRFPVLCCQGAAVFNSESGEVISRIPMTKQSAREFLLLAQSLDLPCQFYTDYEVYAPRVDERNKMYFDINRIMPAEVGDVVKYLDGCDLPVLKVLAMIEPADREKMLAEFSQVGGVKVFASHPMLIEAVSINAGKGNGLIQVCRNYGIDVARSVAIGDELNDIDMIAAAGLGVAMGNAVTEVKAAASYITADNDSDGVAEVLNKIMSGEL